MDCRLDSVTDTSDVQFVKEYGFILTTPVGTVNETRLLQLENAPVPIDVTVLGSSIVVRFRHPLNAYLLIVVTLLGEANFTLCRIEQPSYA